MKNKQLTLRIAILVLVTLVCPSGTRSTKLEWFHVSDGSALCNDFTRAGYFLRRVDTSDYWIIYLESGGLCYSNETCNRRFFLSEVSSRFNRPPSGENYFEEYYGTFDPVEAWNETIVSGREAAVDVVSPLMTSMRCFENKTDYFPQGFSVQGTDILDQDCEKNPLFCDYNHVVIPYCSSDLWLGSEVDGTRNSTAARGECTQCFDYSKFQIKIMIQEHQCTGLDQERCYRGLGHSFCCYNCVVFT